MSARLRRSHPGVFAAALAGVASIVFLTSGAVGRSLAPPSPPAPTAPSFDLTIHEGGTSRPDLCLRIALDRASSYECGNLRIEHPLPTTVTQAKARTPVLTYNSSHASPYVLVPVHITLPAGGTTPDKVTVELRTPGGALLAEGTWTGSAWTPGTTRRVTVGFASTAASGVYDYDIEVANWYGATPYAVTGTGQYTVVNRSNSPFGAGWWLAGLEELDVATMTVIDGAGGVRKYTPAGPDRWVAMNVDRPDTLVKEVGQYNTHYVRRLPKNVRVRFTTSGQHIQTESFPGRLTRFWYSGGRLGSIELPAPTQVKYALSYTNGYLTGVTAPGGRVTSVARNGAVVDSIRDPGYGWVKFVSTASRITLRRDRRHTVTTFSYDAQTHRLGQITVAPVHLGLTTILTPAEGRGYGSGATPVASAAVSEAYALLDGPRTDVADETRFWIDPFGSPSQVQDAVGGVTTLARTDPNFPALVTLLTYPDSYQEKAIYDVRGRLAQHIRLGPRGTGQNDTTRYTYFPTTGWRADFVKEIAPPKGAVSRCGMSRGTWYGGRTPAGRRAG